MTLRQEVEQYLGIAKPARVRQRYPMIHHETPSHWRKTLKVWATVVLMFVGLSFIGGVAVGLIGRV
jgi:hypothetical protein